LQVEDDGLDEEDRYSSVLRGRCVLGDFFAWICSLTTFRCSGKYVPPAKRKQQALSQSRESDGEYSPLRKGAEMSNSAESLPEFVPGGVNADSKPRRNSRGLLGQPPRSPKLSPTLSKFNVDSSNRSGTGTCKPYLTTTTTCQLLLLTQNPDL